jgi:iron-sulfur cluster assembly protein/iron-sulfur cluster insertion protein
MSFDLPKETDREIVSEGVKMLVDPASHEQLGEVSIDFDDGLHGKGFEIRNPKAKTTCGCGKSFN